MIQTRYLIDGLSIMSDDFRLRIGTTFLPTISQRVDSVTVNGRNGVIVPSSPMAVDAPEITVKAFAKGDSAVTLMRRFYRLCRQASALTRIDHDTATGLSRRMSARAVCTSCEPDGDDNPWSGVSMATAVFLLPDVYWSGELWQEKVLPATGGLLLAGGVKPSTQKYWTRWKGERNASPSLLADFYTFWTGLPNNSPSVLVPLGEGIPEGWLSDAPITTLVLRFGVATGVTISDPVSGTNLMWGGKRDASRPYLFVDAANRKAWTAANADAWSGGVDASNGIDWTTEPLQVWPDISSGDYRLAIKQTGSADKVTCRFLQSWE